MDRDTERSITRLFPQLQAGDEEAARQLWERYFTRLAQAAERRLGERNRRVFDGEDVALSVFQSLCSGARKGRFAELAGREELWRLLVAITQRKVIDYKRRERALKRGGGDVRGESVFEDKGRPDHPVGLGQFGDEQPSPEYLNELDEEYRRLLTLLRDETLRNIALWRMQGDAVEDIARRLDVSERTVKRKLQLIRDKWSRELDL